jgi:FdhD protein
MSKDSIPNKTLEVPARRYRNGSLEPQGIHLAREVPYTLFVNDSEVLSIATLPTHLEELFTGFLVSEGILESPSEIVDSAVDHGSKIVRIYVEVPKERLETLQRKGMLTSGCAGGLTFNVEQAAGNPIPEREPIKMKCSTVLGRMRDLDTFQGTYRLTRGVHAASAASLTETLVTREDLGRHNAVDKVVGHCFLNRMETRDKILLTTGRITSEVLIKATRSRFPMVISRSSSSAMAELMAKQAGVDLVTYVRGGRFNYFPHGGVELIED